MTSTHWVLTFVCPDQPGIVHAVTGAIVAAKGNITESKQFSSDDTGRFFMRLQIESTSSREEFERELAPVLERYKMEHTLDVVGRKLRTLVLVSKSAHCLNDILFRQRAGYLPIEIPAVFSNHGELGELAEFYSVPFEQHEIKDAGTKSAFEHMLRDYIKSAGIELVVLARFMQILSPEFVAEFAQPSRRAVLLVVEFRMRMDSPADLDQFRADLVDTITHSLLQIFAIRHQPPTVGTGRASCQRSGSTATVHSTQVNRLPSTLTTISRLPEPTCNVRSRDTDSPGCGR